MEVIIDTCVIIDALLSFSDDMSREDQTNYDYCWEIIRAIRTKEVTPIVSFALNREYICTPQDLAKKQISNNSRKEKDPTQYCEKIIESLFQASIDIVQIISYAHCYEVTSCKRVCTEHPADDKLINLAIDSDCNIIVTRNISHIITAVEKRTKTKSGKPIIVLNPVEFYYYLWTKCLPEKYKKIVNKSL